MTKWLIMGNFKISSIRWSQRSGTNYKELRYRPTVPTALSADHLFTQVLQWLTFSPGSNTVNNYPFNSLEDCFVIISGSVMLYPLIARSK